MGVNHDATVGVSWCEQTLGGAVGGLCALVVFEWTYKLVPAL